MNRRLSERLASAHTSSTAEEIARHREERNMGIAAGLWGCIVFAAIGIVLVGIAFAINPILGLAVLIGGIGFAVIKSLQFREEVDSDREKQRRAEADRLAAIEQERLDLEREKLEMEREAHRQRLEMERVALLSPEERAERDRRSQQADDLRLVLQVMAEAGRIRDHGSLENLKEETVTCENGHRSSYGQFELPDGRFGCPVCQSARYQFDEEAPGQFHFCLNRLRTTVVDPYGQEWPYLHSFRSGSGSCPLCAWAVEHGLVVQPHNLSLHERADESRATG